MQDQLPSRTAMATAFSRATHLYIDDAPPVFEDDVAFDLLPLPQRRYLQRLQVLSQFWQRRYRQRYSAFTMMRGHVVVRARYAEDALAQARQHGVNRFIVLGAGLDTFAWRQIPPLIDVVEIDHPATQRWKRDFFQQRGLPEPPALTFLPVDFEKVTLDAAWQDNDAPDFISWLGVTYYLTRDALKSTLTTLATRTQPGSQLVLDYWCNAPPTDLFSLPLQWGARVAVAMQGEPMRSFFDPADIEKLAREAGWQVRENCSPREQTRRYLADREDGLSVPSFAYLLRLER